MTKDWLICLFRKDSFDRKLEENPLFTFKKTYDGVVVVAFHGEEREITGLSLVLQAINACLPRPARMVLMQIDKEGIVTYS